MISVVNTNDFELDKKSDSIATENQTKHRASVLDGSGVGTGGGGKSMNSAAPKSALRSDSIETTDAEKVRASMEASDRYMSVVDNVVPGELRASSLDVVMELVGSGSSDNGLSGRNLGAKKLGHEIVVKNGKADSMCSNNEVGNSYNSMLLMFDEFAAGGKVGGIAVVGPLKPVGYGYEIGDMVWGKVNSHPWWPGQIYGEEFASPSVRRSKKEGHLLVAFFGDSSYGWFDPAELIPFDSNYEEKSRQIASKPFLKAVEEAVAELSQMRALGLECRCRNAYNFRDTNVEEDFAVDVGNYEPGAVYSTTQIKNARESFQPREVLSFIEQVALAPTSVEHGGIDFIKNKATVLAYRKAVFEEYDETYSEAFGSEPVRSSRKPPQENAPGKISSRAPLSGRLVIAESLGKGKSSGRPPKVKDHAKKDKYLFKRGDEPKELKVQPKKEAQLTTDEYVWQKREPEQIESLLDFRDLAGKDFGIEKPTSTSSGEAPPGYSNHHVEMSSSPNMGTNVKLISGFDDKLHTVEPGEATVSLKEDIPSTGANTSAKGFEMAPSRTRIELHAGNQLKGSPSENGSKKVKVRKRELSSDKTILVEKKKKKDFMSSDIPQIGVKDGVSVVRKVVARPFQVDVPPKENTRTDHQSSEVRAHTSDTIRDGNIELDFPQILGYLQTLALDPYYGSDREIPVMARKVFLKYRSLVYQKSLALSQLGGDEANMAPRPSKSPSVTAPSDYPSSKDVGKVARKMPPQPRPSVRPEDPTKGGRKRGPFDRQEEIAVNKKKKVNDIKNLTVEKKVVQKTLGAETRPAVASVLKKVRQESMKRIEQPPPSKSSVPTMLVMKFPSGNNIPSVTELKAKFIRFRPDLPAIRSFWKTSTCRVVFRDRKNADAAYQFFKSSRIFGEAKVYLRDMEVEASETEQGKVQTTTTGVQPADERKPSPGMQLKLILKKAGGEEAGAGNGGSRGTTRVKFLLGGEEEQTLMIDSKNNKFSSNASFADGGASSSTTSHATVDFNSKNFHKVNLPSHMSSTPILPLPIPSTSSSHDLFARPQSTMHYSSVLVTPQVQKLPPPAPRNALQNYDMPVFVPHLSEANVDIAPQMLSLLTMCNDVVANVSNWLGYVPYHPL